MSDNSNETILKQSLVALYQDKPEIIERIKQINFTQLTEQYYNVLYQHITKEEFERVDVFMRSPEAIKYAEAIQNATMVVVNGLEDVLQFVEQIKHDKEKCH